MTSAQAQSEHMQIFSPGLPSDEEITRYWCVVTGSEVSMVLCVPVTQATSRLANVQGRANRANYASSEVCRRKDKAFCETKETVM